MLNRRLLSPPPSAGLPSGFTSLDYITATINDRIIRDGEVVGASDVVYLDHQFEVMPTWDRGSNPGRFVLYSDSYRELRVTHYGSFGTNLLPDEYRYESLSSSSSDDPTHPISTDRVFMSMYNTALSINGVIEPSTVLSPMYFDFRNVEGTNNPSVLESVTCRIYGCYVLDVLDWRHYMVPCLRVSDGREGLYDLVDGVFAAILYRNIITYSSNGELTSTYPVASDLTVVVRTRLAVTTITFPNGSSSVSTGNKDIIRSIESITPTYDDSYYYIAN